MPVERYAVAFVEHQQAPMTLEELQKAEVQFDILHLVNPLCTHCIFLSLSSKVG